MKGIILAGGNGTRLHPLTLSISKHLLPIYNYPMIYYPFITLIKSGISDILVICKEQDIKEYDIFFQYIISKKNINYCHISYAIQNEPKGIAEAFLIAEKYNFYKKGNGPITLILGDNIFYSDEINKEINNNLVRNNSAIFTKKVLNPERYGVYNYDLNSIIEKPKNKNFGNLAVTGLYIYNDNIIEICKNLKPSDRGELEITDVNNIYLQKNIMNVIELKNTQWFDAGTFDSLLDCSNFIVSIVRRNGEIF